MKNLKTFLLLLILIANQTFAQQTTPDKSNDLKSMKWVKIANKMPEEWYGSDEAKMVAENVLISQKALGGWEKNKNYQLPFTTEEKEHYTKDKTKIGGTFDNGSTITEMLFLAKVYAHLHDERYKKAFENGMNYIFISQYKNGGWPQYFPAREGNVSYSGHITYNDDAMVNTMNLLKEIYSDDKEYASLKISDAVKVKAKKAFDDGVQCILKTQIIQNNKLTIWCAQHDEITLAPANARAYELASLSGSESVGIVQLLMRIKNPSKEIIAAVDGAQQWFVENQIKGIRLDKEIGQDGKTNLIVVPDAAAEPVWARFYELDTNRPYFCSRDGIKRYSIAEISFERRNSYGWYTYTPDKILEKYPEWKKKLSQN